MLKAKLYWFAAGCQLWSAVAYAQASSDGDADTSQKQDAELLLVNVQGDKPSSAADGYRTHRAELGAFGELSLKQVPFSLNVTPSELWENRIAHTEQEVLQNNPTVSNLMAPLAPGGGGMSRTMVRGGTMGDQGVLRDGLVDRGFTYPWFETVERVEVMNGYSSLLNGFGTTGGTINYVSKRPTDHPLANVTVGNYQGGTNFVTGDVSGPLPLFDLPKLKARSIFHQEAGNTFVDGSSERRTLFSTVVTHNPRENIELGADFTFQNFFAQGLQNYIDVNPSKGIFVPSASRLDPHKQLGQDWTFNESRKLLAGLSAKVRLSKVISVRAAYRYGDMWRRYNTTFGTFTDNDGNYSEKYITTPKQTEVTHSYYALADVRFGTGPIQHTITAGYNGTQFYYKRGNDVATDLGMSSLSQPLVVPEEPARTSGAANASRTYYDSLILGDHAQFGPLSVIAGVNYAQIRANSWTIGGVCTTAGQCPAGGVSDSVEGAFTPSVGVTYQPWSRLALYGSYIEALQQGGTAPTGAVNAYEIMPSTHSSQFEMGAKWDWARTQWSLALFRMNQINAYLNDENYYRQDGRQINTGAELTLSGLILPRLTAVGGFTWMRSRVTQAASEALEDKVPVNVPQATGRAYFEWALPGISGLTLNAAANINGSRYVDTANADHISASVTFDAGARYEFLVDRHPMSVVLFVSNLTDQRYWAYYRQGSGLLAGTPRIVSVSLRGGLL